VEQYKAKDPLEMVLKTILDNKLASQNEIDIIVKGVQEVVEDSVKFAEESPYPDPSELYKDVYVQSDYPYIME
jgi:pyruvate dehydrogenase E1 component alpha subunit